MAQIVKAEIFYLNPDDGWAMTWHDKEGNQVGDAGFAFRRRTLLRWAASEAADLPVEVYTRAGRYQYTRKAHKL